MLYLLSEMGIVYCSLALSRVKWVTAHIEVEALGKAKYHMRLKVDYFTGDTVGKLGKTVCCKQCD